MKVAYLVNQYPHVAHTFIRREINSLEKQGFEIIRVSIRNSLEALINAEDLDERKSTNVILESSVIEILTSLFWVFAINPLRFVKTSTHAIGLGIKSHQSVKHVFYFVEACILARLLSKQDCKHVHAHFGTNPATVAYLCRQLKLCSFSFTVHGPEEFDRPKQIHLREKVNAAKFVVSISRFGRSQLYRWADVADWPKIHIVRCGIAVEEYEAGFDTCNKSWDIVCVGRLAEQKGQAILIEALRNLNERGMSYRTIIIGDGPERNHLEQLICEAGLNEQITLADWKSQSEVRSAIIDSKLFVLPSFAEGLPVVLMEAIALSTPCISTHIAGIPELIKHKKSGMLVYASDTRHLADTILEILSYSSSEIKSLTAEAKEILKQFHDVNVETEKLGSLFMQLSLEN